MIKVLLRLPKFMNTDIWLLFSESSTNQGIDQEEELVARCGLEHKAHEEHRGF